MRLNLGRDKEGGCDGALEEVANRHILVYFLGNLRVRVWALESVLMHSKRREHKLPPDLGLGPEDLGRRYVNGVGSIVTFELYKQNPLKTQSWQSFLFWLEASLINTISWYLGQWWQGSTLLGDVVRVELGMQKKC